MLHGIDISNWQAGIIPSSLSIDFCISKATGGTHYIDPYCDGFIQDCIKHNIPWGFYHFGNDGVYDDAADEAFFFMKHCKNYFGYGIPILDCECDSINVDWVNTFVNIIHSETGIWPWIYANPWRFNQGGVEPNCMRWIAAYPNIYKPSIDYDPGEPPETDGLVGCWQFASDGQVPGYNGDLDVNIFYGDLNAWNKYAGVTNSQEPLKPIVHILEDSNYKITIERK